MIVWPGLRRSVSAISRLFNSASFVAPLTHTAVPTRAATGTTATFTRATAKTWPNNDGFQVTGLAGEIGFVGARRIDNLIRLGAAQSSTLAVAASVTMTLPAGAYQFSMGAGTGTVTFSGTGGATGTLAASASGRTFVAKTISAGTLIVTASVATLIDIQVVSMVAETDQTTLREYVSVGLVQRNILGYTGNIAGTGWATANITVTTNQIANPIDGRVNVSKIAATASAATLLNTVGLKTADSTQYCASIYVKKGSGATDANLFSLYTVTGGAELNRISINYDTGAVTQIVGTGGSAVDVGNGWYRLSLPSTAVTVGHSLSFYTGFLGGAETAGEFAYFYAPQLESGTTATSFQETAGSLIYHGSMVDGVKCFATDISGNPIPSTTLLGYSAEGARTNYALWNRDLTNVAWTKTSCTAALTATGADNAANSASTLTATAGNATCLQSITRVSAQRVTGCKIKRRTGTGTINMTQDNGVTWTPVTVTSAYTNVAIPAATAANPIIGFQIVTNGDAIDVDFVMHEEAAFVSSSIATTTIAVARNADVLTYSSAGNFSDTAGWCYAETTFYASSTQNKVLLGSTTIVTAPMYQGTAGYRGFDGTNAPLWAAGMNVANTTYKTSATWGGSAMSGGITGTVSTPSSYDGSWGFSNIQIGGGNGTNELYGTIRNVRIGQRQLSSSELQAITQ